MFKKGSKDKTRYDRIEVDGVSEDVEGVGTEGELGQTPPAEEETSALVSGEVRKSCPSISQSGQEQNDKNVDDEKSEQSAASESVNVQAGSGGSKIDTQEEKAKIIDEPLKEVGADETDTMVLNVKGTDDRTHKVRISEQASVSDLKEKIASITEFGIERQRLIFLGKMLDDALKLCDYNIKDGNFIHLVPKPAGFVPPPADDGPGSNDETINLHDIPIGLFGDPGRGLAHAQRDVEYFQTLSLGLWRARIRLMSSLMLFYYFLQFMTNLSFWLHPDQANFQFEEGHHPTDLYFAIDAMENVAGMVVAWWGLKTAAEDCTVLSKRFFVGVCRLCFLHFISLAVYSQQLLSGQIVLKSLRHYSSEDKSELSVSVVFNVLINLMIWATCVGIASRYHAELLALNSRNERPSGSRRSSNADEETGRTMQNPTVVIVQ